MNFIGLYLWLHITLTPTCTEPNLGNNDSNVKEGLNICMKRLVKDVVERKILICNLFSLR